MEYHKQDDDFYDGDLFAPKLMNIDPWEEQEVDNLRQDLEEAECAQIEAEDAEEVAADLAAFYQNKYQQIKVNIQEKVDKKTGQLVSKAMIYLDLISEYETVLVSYARHSQVKLTTSKITNLRKRGGLE